MKFLNSINLIIALRLVCLFFFNDADLDLLMDQIQADNPNAYLKDYIIVQESDIANNRPGRVAFIFSHDSIFNVDIYADDDNLTQGSECLEESPPGSDNEEFNFSDLDN